ncbi:MAG: DNA-directed RNA polymerase subunit omega [Candidatus Omnitrophica bacterium]|nr:DNA-directed RNA polymerase subunit omega [Candidatus Omnitrophota bacterium]MCM8792869.1 DNA-directed RNA polymerase subunit omega [Candidatus Omnitrophota bacterium]
MAYVPLEKVLKNVESIYKAVNLASKRAIELNEGAPKLVNVNSTKLSSIALEEIMQGKIKYKKIKKEGK